MSEHFPELTAPGSRPRTMEVNWRVWDPTRRWPLEGELRVVGTALKTQGPRSLGLPGYRNSLGYCLRLRKKSLRFSLGNQSTRASLSGTAGPPGTAALCRSKVQGRPGAPVTTVVPLKGPVGSGVPLKPAQARTKLSCHPQAYWPRVPLTEPRSQKSLTLSARSGILRGWQASETISLASVTVTDLWEEGLDSGRRFIEDSTVPLTSYFSLVCNFLKPEKPTKAATRLMEKTAEVMKLDKQIKEAQIRQRAVLEETRPLLQEKFHVQADTQFMLDHLTNKTEEYRREINKLWDRYTQESGELQRRRQELASVYAKRTAELQKQILEKEKKEFDLNRQLRAMKDILLVKEKQDREVQTLQEELKKACAETTAKAYAQYFQEKAELEKQLSEPDLSQLGKKERRELQREAQALELAAESLAFECCQGLRTENQWLQGVLGQHTRRHQEVQAAYLRLQKQKQLLLREQWYAECLIRGRRRLQQGPPKTTGTPSLVTK